MFIWTVRVNVFKKSSWRKTIWSLCRMCSSTWWQNLCWNLRGQTCLVVGYRSCTHPRRFVPLLFAHPYHECFVADHWQLEPAASSTDFYWLGHFKISICFFLSQYFVVLAVCFGSLLESMPWLREEGFHPVFDGHGNVHPPFDAVPLSCPLGRKTHKA